MSENATKTTAPSPEEVKKVIRQIKAKEELGLNLLKQLAEVESYLAQYGIKLPKFEGKVSATKETRKNSPPKDAATEESLLAFIGTGEHKTGDIQANFGGGASKTSKLLAKLVKAEKLTKTKREGKGAPAFIYKKSK